MGDKGQIMGLALGQRYKDDDAYFLRHGLTEEQQYLYKMGLAAMTEGELTVALTHLQALLRARPVGAGLPERHRSQHRRHIGVGNGAVEAQSESTEAFGIGGCRFGETGDELLNGRDSDVVGIHIRRARPRPTVGPTGHDAQPRSVADAIEVPFLQLGGLPSDPAGVAQ